MCCSTPKAWSSSTTAPGKSSSWSMAAATWRPAALRERFPEVPGIDEDILAFLEVAHAQFWIELQ